MKLMPLRPDPRSRHPQPEAFPIHHRLEAYSSSYSRSGRSRTDAEPIGEVFADEFLIRLFVILNVHDELHACRERAFRSFVAILRLKLIIRFVPFNVFGLDKKL